MASSETVRRHTQDDVARTALRLLDDVGLPDLTMRRLAAALDVQPSALYHHFPNKQALLADLADRIVSPRPVATTSGEWDRDVRSAAAALRDGLLAYRDGAEVVASTLSMGLGADAALRRLSDSIALGGFDEATTRRAATALLHFVLGHVSHEQQRLQYDSLGVVVGRGPDASADAFAFGVDLLVEGLRARVVSYL
ncbi:TetR family transcriptional regulator [Microbacterium protaetiae]|uniref:TetR family transcriptional regulator n=1 Tax=Microbacterium protaetiae TaxID=2509458 RepID=A0A4P6EBR1_9MICO|nr:TetR family transcriptional regulator [Microbacterium protaetiae]QAY59414.1 TetR family transcriptional regulator [Microbacterium protaetiae]